ncbi:hypothetical protein AB1046_07930 [Promicromonospora sp. Populi]|uniref:hypothetical protein n=1 Tax=Promicromonospora sp. Populi TaxID=3239420 RepID=UPI0034E1A19C
MGDEQQTETTPDPYRAPLPHTPTPDPYRAPLPPNPDHYQAPLPYTSYAPVNGSPVTGSPVAGSPVTGSPVAGSPVAGQAAPSNPQATASLVLGIVSIVASIVFLPAIVGVVLGIVGVLRSGLTDPPVGRAKAIVGIVLSVLSVPIGVALVDQIATGVRSGLAGLEQAMEEGTEEGAPTAHASQSASPVPDLAEFIEVDAAEWESIVDDPNQARDRPVVVFAEVMQFGGSTGSDRFLASTGVDQPGELELQTDTLLIGDEALLDGVETGDVLKVHAVVTGSFEYETQVGGTATVPVLVIAQLEDVGYADLSKDVTLGTTVSTEIGWAQIPATVTNSSQRTFTYAVDVVAESKDGSTSYATGTGFAEDLEPGQQKEVTVDFFEDLPADAVFRIEKVERYPE